MTERTLRALTAAAGTLVVGFTVYFAAVPGLTPADYPSGFRAPVMALELPADRIELGLALDAGPGNRDYWRRLTRADMFYPVAYAAFLILVAWTVSARAPGRREGWAWLASALFLTAALADYFENVAIFTALDIPARLLVDDDARHIRIASLIKWSLLAGGFLCVARLLLAGPGKGRWLAAPALLMALGLLGWGKPAVVEWATVGMLVVCVVEWARALIGLVRRTS